MNLVKKHFYIVVLMALMTTAVGCKKFLEPEAVSSFDVEYIFDDVQNARKALLGAYMSMSGDFGYGIRISGYWPYDTDELLKGTNPNTNDEGQLLAKYLGIPSNLQITNPFNQMYQGIERANLCIYNIPKMAKYTGGNVQEQAQLKRMHGEALVLRAQYYYELCRNFGDVPAQWQPSQYETELYKPRTSRDSIYDRLLRDLQEAQALMPWRTEVPGIGDPTDQRFTKGAAKALRAKIALTRGGYALSVSQQTMVRSADYLDYYKIARDECAEIIANPAQHDLYPSYKGLFKEYLLAHNLNDPSGEFIMVASMAFGTNSDSKLGIQTGTRMNGTGGGNLSVLPTYFYMFDSTDIRRDITCVPYEITFDTIKTGHTINTINDGKFRREWVTNPSFVFSSGNSAVSNRPAINNSLQNMQLSWPLIRFADVLLWYAEAENELNGGPTAGAIDAVSRVNKRGHGGSYTETAPVIPNDKTGFFKFLVKERMLEFGGEGVRKYDLIRWNLLETAIRETRARLQAWAGATETNHPPLAPYSYMADGPAYASDASQLPSYLYFFRTPPRSNIDDFNPFLYSYYKPGPVEVAPAGQVRVAWWIGGTVTAPQTFTNAFAQGFTANKSELMPLPQTQRDVNPNLSPQNPGY
ncbi:RagB/SusD family nutrient uptake outer membrane protein [Chitinophaga rhizophila]|uniref:RagB/SusD family nutrient uptake outer membrane protein n=1 Tax=Chitinophaga rhizophila TaxID=2866212 RepID=A0ABS7GAI2_9BACT|nr:RagB/SusD family nutrient uptake outer membrane protein [Chitinophaga rhizophila]MBW8684671.1 RagB/SusD family nutrient uptake outer membrane protein [Chitinophaga rhizophila]